MSEINIENLTLKQIRELNNLMARGSERPFQTNLTPGRKLFIRTVTHYFLGEVVSSNEHELVLKKASWVASTGRRDSEFLARGIDKEAEIEPYPGELIVFRGVIVNVSDWPHELPLVAQ